MRKNVLTLQFEMDNRNFLNKVSKSAEIDHESCLRMHEALMEIMEEALSEGETISIPSFGNFEPRKRNERIMTHPSDKGKRLLVPPKIVVSFKPSTILKEKINK